MITDMEEIKRRLRENFPLLNKGDGWLLGRRCGKYSKEAYDQVPAELVALLSAQGFIKTDLRVVGSASWVEPTTVSANVPA